VLIATSSRGVNAWRVPLAEATATLAYCCYLTSKSCIVPLSLLNIRPILRKTMSNHFWRNVGGILKAVS
jgi:hypothetical protein